MHTKVKTKDSDLPLDLDRIQWYFRNWMKSNPFDMGMTICSALNILESLQKPDPDKSFENTKKKTGASQSNGCLMRITPLSVFCSKLDVIDMYQAVRL